MKGFLLIIIVNIYFFQKVNSHDKHQIQIFVLDASIEEQKTSQATLSKILGNQPRYDDYDDFVDLHKHEYYISLLSLTKDSTSEPTYVSNEKPSEEQLDNQQSTIN